MSKVGEAVKSWKRQNPQKPFVEFLVGDTQYAGAKYVIREIVRSVKNDKHKYSAPAGDPNLLNALVKDYERMGITGLDPEKNLCVTHGTLEAFTLSCLSLLNPGDEAILPAPYYFLYPFHVVAAGGFPCPVKTGPENGFKLTPEILKEKITKKQK